MLGDSAFPMVRPHVNRVCVHRRRVVVGRSSLVVGVRVVCCACSFSFSFLRSFLFIQSNIICFVCFRDVGRVYGLVLSCGRRF